MEGADPFIAKTGPRMEETDPCILDEDTDCDVTAELMLLIVEGPCMLIEGECMPRGCVLILGPCNAIDDVMCICSEVEVGPFIPALIVCPVTAGDTCIPDNREFS